MEKHYPSFQKSAEAESVKPGLTKAIIRESEKGVISLESEMSICSSFGMDLFDLETIVLQSGIMPLRFARNSHTIEARQQLLLHNAYCIIIGCGGIGGHIAHLLARYGIGRLMLFDPDKFDESNLNRQTFSDTQSLKLYKSEQCANALRQIDPAAKIDHFNECFPQIIPDRYLGSSMIFEASDSPGYKRILTAEAAKKDIPLINTAVAGRNMILSMGIDLGSIYRDSDPGGEKWSGNLAATCAAAAGIAVSQGVDFLLSGSCRLENKMLFVDIKECEMTWIAP